MPRGRDAHLARGVVKSHNGLGNGDSPRLTGVELLDLLFGVARQHTALS